MSFYRFGNSDDETIILKSQIESVRVFDKQLIIYAKSGTTYTINNADEEMAKDCFKQIYKDWLCKNDG